MTLIWNWIMILIIFLAILMIKKMFQGLTHWGQVTYMHQLNIRTLIQLMACCLASAKPLYMNQCWNIVNWTLGNNLQNLNQNIYISFKKKHLKMLSWKWRPFCCGLNVLMNFCAALTCMMCGGCILETPEHSLSLVPLRHGKPAQPGCLDYVLVNESMCLMK